MHILVVGLDHHTAPVEIREQFAFRTAEVPQALAQLTTGDAPVLHEAAILATCNRVEVYGTTVDPAAAQTAIIDFLHTTHNLPPNQHSAHFFAASDQTAVRQLFTTTCGLNSLVVGEPQIQGQVRVAYEIASAAHTSGPLLHALFRHALAVGKRARSETGIDRCAASVSQAGVELARSLLGDLSQARVLLVGSGRMSELAAQNLLNNGAASITMVNRTLEKAQEIAQEWGGRVVPFEQLSEAIRDADVVISSTAAPHTVIHSAEVSAAMADRTSPLILIDLAVPRDIDPEVAMLSNVHLYNIDDLQGIVAANLLRRQGELGAVETIVDAEVDRFLAWSNSRAVLPTINGLREQAEGIRKAELAKALRQLGSLSDRERQIVEALSAGIVNKLLHQPTVRLKHAAAQGSGNDFAAALHALFGLDDGSHSCHASGVE